MSSDKYRAAWSSGAQNLYYKPSGKFPIYGPLAILLIGGFCAVAGGALYGAVCQWNPCKCLNMIGTLIFAFVLGIGVMLGAQAGKVRSPFVAASMGLLVGLAAFYVQWIFFAHAWTDEYTEAARWFHHALDLFTVMNAAAEQGGWPLEGMDLGSTARVLVKWSFFLFWVLEAIAIVGMSAYLGYYEAHDSPFCEQCGKWAVDQGDPAKLGLPESEEMLKMDLENGDIDALAKLGEPSPMGYTEVKLAACPNCGQKAWLVVNKVTVENPADQAAAHSGSYLDPDVGCPSAEAPPGVPPDAPPDAPWAKQAAEADPDEAPTEERENVVENLELWPEAIEKVRKLLPAPPPHGGPGSEDSGPGTPGPFG